MKRTMRNSIGLGFTLASGLLLLGCDDEETPGSGGPSAGTSASAGSDGGAGSGNSSGAGGSSGSSAGAGQAGATASAEAGAGGDAQGEGGPSVAEFFELVPQMFQLNQQRQEEGYYMAEFEFKMLGLVYYLDQGQPEVALARGQELYSQLVTTEGLTKVPAFDSVREEYEFYRDRQNPTTGAFMDDTYPLCTYTGPTENVLLHLAELAEELDEPLSLKYPLTYLDEIADPEALVTLLDSLSTISEAFATFPETPYELAREMLGLHSDESIISVHDLYSFSDEWRTTMLTWFYDNQDEETGFWGPRVRETGELVAPDVTNTAGILKWFVDRSGNDLYEEFPLRHRSELFSTTLSVMSQPVPAADEPTLWHSWNLSMSKGTNLLTRYVWKGASLDDKAAARDVFEWHLTTRFERQYVAEEGAFSYYPDAEHATLDGTGTAISSYQSVGALSFEQQKVLWDSPLDSAQDLGTVEVDELSSESVESVATCDGVSSVRFYLGDEPDDLNSEVLAVYYPEPPKVLDAVDMVPRLARWLLSTDQTMGNWISKAELQSELGEGEIEETTVSESLPADELESALERSGAVTAIGLDVLQIPRCKLTLTTGSAAEGS